VQKPLLKTSQTLGK